MANDESYEIGYFYMGDRPTLNDAYGYALPNRITEDPSKPLFGDSNAWSPTWNWTAAAHTPGGGLFVWPDGGSSAAGSGSRRCRYSTG